MGRRRKRRAKIGVMDKSHIYGPSGREAEAREVGGKGSESWTRGPQAGNVANSV